MTLKIEVQPELEANLAAQAKAQGLSIDAYVRNVLEREARCYRAAAADEKDRQNQREAAGDSIRQLRKGNHLGDVTIRELIEEGRRY